MVVEKEVDLETESVVEEEVDWDIEEVDWDIEGVDWVVGLDTD